VEGDDDAVARGVDVGLDVAQAQVDRGCERGHGVLQAVEGESAVRHGDRAVDVEEGVCGHVVTLPTRADTPG
jgi:hypothetical protein